MPDPETGKTRRIILSTNAGVPDGTTLHTPEGMPDLVVKTKSPIKRTVIRILRIYFQSFGGMLFIVMGNAAPDSLRPPEELWAKIVLSAGFALSPSAIALLSNLTEYLVREDAQ